MGKLRHRAARELPEVTATDEWRSWTQTQVFVGVKTWGLHMDYSKH